MPAVGRRGTRGVGRLGAARQRGDVVGQRLGRALRRVEAAEHHRIGDRRARRGLRALEPGEPRRDVVERLVDCLGIDAGRRPAGPRGRSTASRSRRAAGSRSAADFAAARERAAEPTATATPPAGRRPRRRRCAAMRGPRQPAIRRRSGTSGGRRRSGDGGWRFRRRLGWRRRRFGRRLRRGGSGRNFGRRQVDHGRRPAPARASGRTVLSFAMRSF